MIIWHFLFFVNFQQTTQAYNMLISEEFGASVDQLKTYKSLCHKRFPHATIFREIQPVTVTVAETATPASWKNKSLNI